MAELRRNMINPLNFLQPFYGAKIMEFKKQLIKNILILFIISTSFFGGIIFLKIDIAKKVDSLKELKSKLLSGALSREEFFILQKDMERARQYSTEMDSYLLRKDQLLNLPKDIAQIGRQNNLGTSFSFGEESQFSQFSKQTNFSISLEGEGGIMELINFLATLENSRYFIKLISGEYNQSGRNLKAVFSGQVYSF